MRALTLLIVVLCGCDQLFGVLYLPSGPNDAGVDSTVPSSWTSIAAGSLHTCGVKADGTLWCWGNNELMQSDGTNAAVQYTTPHQVGRSIWKAIAAGDQHTCGVQIDGSLWCWGDDSYGEAGDNNAGGTRALGHVLPGATWLQVTAGAAHTCAIRDDHSLWCWGLNLNGQLAQATPATQPAPTQITAAPANWASVSAGSLHTCAIDSDQALWCWGYNGSGQLGVVSEASVSTPMKVPGAWVAVSAGHVHTCAIATTGAVSCWGANSRGELGDNSNADHTEPMQIGDPATDFVEVVAANDFTCARRSTGAVSCWGDNSRGQLGTSGGASNKPIALPGVWTSIAAGGAHTCVAGDSGLACTGNNTRGQLGDATGGYRLAPAPLMTGLGNVKTGGESSCATTSNALFCWGRNDSSQLGDGTLFDRKVPTVLGVLPLADLALAQSYGCTVRPDGSMACVGDQAEGALGNNATSGVTTDAIPVAGTWSRVSANHQHTCAIDSGSHAYCWGLNTNGQVGNGNTNSPRMTPQALSTVDTWLAIGTGYDFSCGLRGTQASCWGANTTGQLATGDTTDRYIPTAITTHGFTQLSVGWSSACAIEGSSLYCWGSSAYGQLGTQASGSATSPTQVLGSWLSVSSGAEYGCGIQSDRSLWCWGLNNAGQLGDGTVTNRNLPTHVGVDTWSTVSAANAHTCGTKSDGSLWCWGANDFGEIGDDSAWRTMLAPVH